MLWDPRISTTYPNADSIRDADVDLIVSLVNSSALYTAITTDRDPSDCDVATLKDHLARTACPPSAKSLPADDSLLTMLSRLLKAGKLATTDSLASGAVPPSSFDLEALLLADAFLRRHGFPGGVVSPQSIRDGSRVDTRMPTETLVETLQTIEQNTNSGLDGGRLNKGIESLIREYLQKEADNASATPPATEPTAEESTMNESLVDMAEKLRFLGNNDAIFEDLTVEELHKQLNPAATQPPGCPLIAAKDGRDEDPKKNFRTEVITLKMYTPLLQTLGNTILVEENELQAWADHDALQKREFGDAAQAFRTGILMSSASTQPSTLPSCRRPKTVDCDPCTLPTTDPVAPCIEELTCSALQPRAATEPSSMESPKELMDKWITTLQIGYENSVRRFGTHSAKAQNLSDAIEAADKFRIDMIYIRPPSAYLRTSNPASITQNGDDGRWKNLLLDNSFKSLPFGGEYLANWPGESDGYSELDPRMFCPFDAERYHLPTPFENARNRRLVAAEIDRQFWQNINTVRVDGTGATNYVIAKDDIGNWYVKDVGTDTSAITQAATNLFLFSAAGKTASQAVIKGISDQVAKATTRKSGYTGDSSTTQPTTQSADASVRSGQLIQANDEFLSQSKQDYQDVQAKLGEIAKLVTAATQPSAAAPADTTSAKPPTQATVVTVLMANGDYEKLIHTPATQPVEKIADDKIDGVILDDLNNMRRYHTNVSLAAAAATQPR